MAPALVVVVAAAAAFAFHRTAFSARTFAAFAFFGAFAAANTAVVAAFAAFAAVVAAFDTANTVSVSALVADLAFAVAKMAAARAFDDAVAAAFAFPRAAAAFFARAAVASACVVFAAAAFFAVDFSTALTVTFFAADAVDFVADVFAVSPSPSSSGDGSDDEFNQGVGESVDGRTSSGVGSDDKFNQGVGESVDGRTIGKLFVSNREIAKGSNGTIVYEGTHEVRPVAVKRLVMAYHDVAYKEYKNLCASDGHSNIVRLYGVEEDKDFVYLALERCTCSVNDLILTQLLDAPTTSGDRATEVNSEYRDRLQSMKGTLPEVKLWEDNGYPSPTLWKLMRDTVSGLVHLHEKGMIHRDLKPQNVLIVKEGSLCAKLADMGISKRLVGDKSSLGNHASGCGTSGWQAPELLCHGRQTRAIDVFSLGCVLFYCISGGKHPFGDPLVRDVNIVKGKVKLFLVNHIPEAVDLLDHLLDPKAELRPTASEVLIHPMFWDSDKPLLFLCDASDRVEREGRGSAILQELERIAPRVLGTKPASKQDKNMVLLNWDKKIDPSLLNGINNPRRYYYDCVRDLLRFIRNKKNHFFDLPHEIQEILGPVPKGFDGYFRSRFPKLLMEVYKVLHKYCREEEWCNKYFKGSVDCVSVD